MDIPVAAVKASPNQPRRKFAPEALQALADSITAHGLLQPIVVREVEGAFELIAGERRWRAAKLAGLEAIRAICRPAGEADALVLSVIENLQREDLDPIEEASAYRSLAEDLQLTHEQIAAHVGRERSTVTNAMRLLELPPAIQAKLISRALSPGHARVLLAVTDPHLQLALAERAADKGMSVRELEQAVYGKGEGARSAGGRRQAAHLTDLEARISERLGVRAQVVEGKRGGKLVLKFKTNQEFMRILDAIGVSGDGL
jgi:ParB family chromosome partitioning protein